MFDFGLGPVLERFERKWGERAADAFATLVILTIALACLSAIGVGLKALIDAVGQWISAKQLIWFYLLTILAAGLGMFTASLLATTLLKPLTTRRLKRLIETDPELRTLADDKDNLLRHYESLLEEREQRLHSAMADVKDLTNKAEALLNANLIVAGELGTKLPKKES